MSLGSITKEALTVGHALSLGLGAFLHKVYADLKSLEAKVATKVDAAVEAVKKA
jgi:hypothetical protein